METQLVAEFVSKTGASPNDALSCLKTWGWDLKKALIDYNGKMTLNFFLYKSNNNNNNQFFYQSIDTSTNDYFDDRTGLKVSIDTVDSGNSSTYRKPSLLKSNAIDIIDCKIHLNEFI